MVFMLTKDDNTKKGGLQEKNPAPEIAKNINFMLENRRLRVYSIALEAVTVGVAR
jgi:hypothetical protein